MLKGRTHFYEFIRDDEETTVTIEYKFSRYYPATGPSWNDPGSPAEGGEIEDWEVDGGKVTLTDAEAERAQAEIYALPIEEEAPDAE